MIYLFLQKILIYKYNLKMPVGQALDGYKKDDRLHTLQAIYQTKNEYLAFKTIKI